MVEELCKPGIDILTSAEQAFRHFKDGHMVFYYDAKKENVYQLGDFFRSGRDFRCAMEDLDNALIIFARVKEG